MYYNIIERFCKMCYAVYRLYMLVTTLGQLELDLFNSIYFISKKFDLMYITIQYKQETSEEFQFGK
jgi:hypothetical protein